MASALPTLSRAVTIDATSATGHVNGGPPVVGIDFNGNAGLVFGAGSDRSQLLGLAIDNASGNGVTLNAGSITLAGDYIGLNLAGARSGNAGDGLFVATTSNNNVIGSNSEAASGIISNVISGNGGNGISLNGSSGNTLVNNYVGTDPTGATAIANGLNGIWLTGGSNNNTLGGTAYTDSNTGAVNDPTGTKGTVPEVYVVPPLGNLVSGNGQNGILIDAGSQRNVLNGNFVGTSANGDRAIGNALDGVSINGANNNSLIGCTVTDNPFVYYNVVSGNGGNGLHITDSNNTTVQANFFGIGADNTTTVGNALNGILVDGSSSTIQVGGVIPLGNVAAGNGQNGIEVAGSVSGFTTFNTFGGLLAFKGAAPNGNDGLLITATGGNQTVRTNVFSGNTNNGVEIGGNASGVTVDPNIVGLTTNGGTILANGGDGLRIDGTAHANVIGGYTDSVIPENLFSGNVGYGVEITDTAYNNQVFNSYIGVQVFGAQAAGNQAGGVYIGGTATGNVIGGANSTPNAPTADVISGNGGNGVTLASTTSRTSIIDNIIGYGVNGIQPIPNAGDAIVSNASAGNTVSGNTVPYPGQLSTTYTDDGMSANLVGDNGHDIFVGSTGNDTITTGTGNNLIAPGSGNDVMYLHGQDTVFPGSGVDTIFAFGPAFVGMGEETLFFINGSNPSTVIGGSGGPLIAAAGAGGGLYKGSSAGGNVLIGGSGSVALFGAGNNDLLFAGSGGGTLIAGPGTETLSGVAATASIAYFAGTGNDLMGGGSGANTYSFINGDAGGADEIIGFNPSKGDVVALWGYGNATFQTALAHQVDNASGATITLSDTTSITFAGVASLNASSFIVT